MNKSSSPLLHLHLHLHLLHFFDNEQIFIFQKKNKKKNFKKGLGTRGIRLVLPRFLSKNIQNFQFLEKIQDSSKKKKKIQIFNSLKKIQDFQIFQKKKKNQNFQFLLKI